MRILTNTKLKCKIIIDDIHHLKLYQALYDSHILRFAIHYHDILLLLFINYINLMYKLHFKGIEFEHKGPIWATFAISTYIYGPFIVKSLKNNVLTKKNITTALNYFNLKRKVKTIDKETQTNFDDFNNFLSSYDSSNSSSDDAIQENPMLKSNKQLSS